MACYMLVLSDVSCKQIGSQSWGASQFRMNEAPTFRTSFRIGSHVRSASSAPGTARPSLSSTGEEGDPHTGFLRLRRCQGIQGLDHFAFEHDALDPSALALAEGPFGGDSDLVDTRLPGSGFEAVDQL